MVFASRKSRMRAPLHRRTEEIGACVADPFANGEGAEKNDTFTIPGGSRRRVYRPETKSEHSWVMCQAPRCNVRVGSNPERLRVGVRFPHCPYEPTWSGQARS